MALSKKEFSDYIRQFKFRELFNDMGWNNDKTTQPIAIDNITYTLQGVAEKSGFKILLCNPTEEGNIPDYASRKKIETKVTKLFQEHLIIFADAKKTQQVWQLVVRQTGKPVKVTETHYNTSQHPELLYQKLSGLFFELDEEDNITIVDVKKRVSENFHQNNEKVTKQFYDRFKQQHTAFLKFIKGFDDRVNKEWYASLMLNRLMFCYFIQKKGFLDNKKSYLSAKLKECQEKKGKNKFYSFYRNFLLQLFHQGLGSPDHSEELKGEIGKVPYLNGGLFDEHELEKNNSKIEIEDKAFESIFKFFDEWEWHLDTRHAASGRDINPDVIGYIFEKYINDRAQMGAYYTKEDITDYISKNCIIPFLFNSKDVVFDAQALQEHGEKYIYPAVKHGVEHKLPDEISAGIKDVSKRTEWNKPAPPTYGLPTEIWREVIERRNRYHEIKEKLNKGEIAGINDFITYNLDIRQFAQDTIENTNSPDVLKSFYKALNSVTILDPTCGSGAFLFAAMNILEPLYESCIQRMENFVAEAPKGKFKYFEETLAQVKAPEHPNLQYFIYKSIILRNLYGVDIMKEAVEIAKLRLFLKLVATVEADFKKPNLGLEPLPDIDFNIRSGNTLIGFATVSQLKTGSLDFQDDETKVLEEMEKVSMAFTRFKEMQLAGIDINYTDFKNAKNDYQTRLEVLKERLNHSFYNSFGDHIKKYDKWLESSKPFHWFAEYYEIIKGNEGFDVIIGNPPYIEYSKVRKEYVLKNYMVQDSGNLFGFVTERTKQIISSKGYLSLIVPISVTCTQRMEVVQKHIFNSNRVWLSNYGERPSKLFTGAEVLLTIFIVSPEKTIPTHYTTTFIKWKSVERPILFDKLFYNEIQHKPKEYSIPKIGFQIENEILKKIKKSKRSIGLDLVSSGNHKIYYRIGGGRYWKIFTDFSPKFILNGVKSTSSRENYLWAKSDDEKKATISILSSNIFYWYFVLTTNCRDLNPSDLREFPITLSDLNPKSIKELSRLSDLLMADYNEKSVLKEKVSEKTGNITYQEFYPRLSKNIIDKVDTVIASAYGFNIEELDFIINYDIKYRMGKDEDDEE